MRTACHGCRNVTFEMDSEEDESSLQIVLLPGDGHLTREVISPSERGSAHVSRPCSICGNSENQGWVTGFVPPV